MKGKVMLDNIKNLVRTTWVRMRSSITPKENIWIFSSVDNRKYNYNSKYLFEYVKENLPEITPRYVINDDEERAALSQIYGDEFFIESYSVEGIKKVLEGGVWFTSAGLPVYGFGLGKKRRIINLWHGVPLKKIALLENRASWLYRLYFKGIFSTNYDSIYTTSKSLIPIMASSFGVEYDRIKVMGQPRNDLLFQKMDRQEMLKNLYGIDFLVDHVLLYAPTYREFGNTLLFPFEDFDIKALNRFLEQHKIMLLIRYHLEEQQGEYLESQWIRTVNEDRVLDVMEILSGFDGVITDYSSIYIDYLLLERPIIFLPYDQKEYESKRGMNFVYEEVTPGPKPKTMEDFLKEVERLLADGSCYREERYKANLFFNEIQEPCSDRICKTIMKEMRKL